MAWKYNEDGHRDGMVGQFIRLQREGVLIGGLRLSKNDWNVVTSGEGAGYLVFIERRSSVDYEGELIEVGFYDFVDFVYEQYRRDLSKVLGEQQVLGIFVEHDSVWFQGLFSDLSVGFGEGGLSHEHLCRDIFYAIVNRMFRQVVSCPYIDFVDDALCRGGVPIGWDGDYPQGRGNVYSPQLAV